jgi:hypothetical protein
VTVSRPAAVTTAYKSSAHASKVGRSASDTGSDSPVPRASYVTTLANECSRSQNTDLPAGGWKSWFENHDATDTTACGPRPRARNASRASPLVA